MKQNLFLPLCTSLSLIEDCCQDPIGVFPALHQSTPTPQPLRDSSNFLMRRGDHVCHSCLDCLHVATIFLEAQRYPKTRHHFRQNSYFTYHSDYIAIYTFHSNVCHFCNSMTLPQVQFAIHNNPQRFLLRTAA